MIQDLLQNSANEAIRAATLLKSEKALRFMEDTALAMSRCFQNGGKLLLAGNGGSLCDAAHFAEELTGVFRGLRPALPALVLNDPGHMSCVANDLGYDFIFSRAVEAFGRPNDIFIGFTTSGNSMNLIRAFETAKKQDLVTVAFLGRGGGKLSQVADYEWVVDGFSFSDRIQEAHMAAAHMIIEALEHLLFQSKKHTNLTMCAARS